MSLEDSMMFIYQEVKEKGLQEKFDKQLEKIQDWLKYFNKNTISYFSKGGGGADIGPLHRRTGTPMFGLSIDGQKYFEIHHTEKDVFESIHPREMELGTASMASLVYLIDKYGL